MAIDRACLEPLLRDQGFILVGVTLPQYGPQDFARFERWIDEGRHAEMAFLERHRSVRADPRQLLPGCRSVIVVALPYYQQPVPSAVSVQPQVAMYARYPDYHRVVRRQLEAIAATVWEPGSFRVTVDSAPVLERALAARCGHGFVGKNTLFIMPGVGSYFVLAEILTHAELAPDTPQELPLDRKTRDGGCGPCRQCQVACPTGALDEDYRIDARRCLAYWTIENRGTIPKTFWPWLKDTVFGCDLCQVACPYNKRPVPAPAAWTPREFPDLATMAMLSQEQYERYFGGTPLTRAGRAGLRRNALIAMAVTGHPQLDQAVRQAESETDPMLLATCRQVRS